MTTALDPTTRGRDSELAVLGEQLDCVRSGSAAVVLIEGQAGMGTSRLIDEAVRIAHRLSLAVGSGVAEPSESVAELAPLLRALFDGPEPLLDRGALSSLHAVPERRYWLLQDLQSLLERAAMDGPLVICLDDLQWADSGTVAALRALPPRLASLPIGWVLAMRPDHGAAQLRSTVDQLTRDGATRLVLEPLSQAAVAQVATDVLQAKPDQALLRMAEGAGGNPFLLVELLLGLRQEQLLRIDAGQATLAATELPEQFRSGVRDRLAQMSDSAQHVAIVAASLGRTFSFSDLAAMLSLPPASLLAPVGELIEASILRECGDRLGFRHDLTREAARYADGRSARRALDRQAADVLLAGGALPVEVAARLAASAEPGDERAIATLRDAAEAIGTCDPGAAADLSRRALELAPRKHPLRGPLAAQTTILLHAAARSDEAQTFAEEYMQGVLPTAELAEVALSIANMFALSPDIRARASRRALALPDLSSGDRARHLARLVYNLVHAGRPEEAQSLLPQARAVISPAEHPTAASILQVTEGALLYGEGHFEQALQVHEAAMRRGFDRRDPTREGAAAQWRCELLAVLDRLDESMRVISEDIATAQHDRQGWALDFLETWRGRQLLQRGRLADAAAALEGRFDPEEAHKVGGALHAAGVVALGRVAIHTDDERQKRETAAFAKAMLEASTPANRRHGAWLLALGAMADGDPSKALAWLGAPDGAEHRLLLPLFPMDVTDEPQLVRIALAGGDLALATETVALAERRARRSPDVSSVRAAAAHARGLLDDDTAELARAAELFGRERPLALASAVEDLGTAHARRRSREPAVEALGRALVLYADAGARRDAHRVRRRLRAQGVRRRLATAERPEHGWDALTESELGVVRLVAEGLTNRDAAERLFVSPNTVNSHLRHAFLKLGVNSRVELSRLVSHESP